MMGLAVVCSVLISVCYATTVFAQVKQTPRTKLEVALLRFEGEKNVDTQVFQYRLALEQQGSLKVAVPPSDAASEGVSCLNSNSRTQQLVGTQVDATVSAADESSFKVHLVLTDRSFAGCRPVGDLEIPVFGNRTVTHDLVLKDGGSEELVMDLGETSKLKLKVRVTLTILA